MHCPPDAPYMCVMTSKKRFVCMHEPCISVNLKSRACPSIEMTPTDCTKRAPHTPPLPPLPPTPPAPPASPPAPPGPLLISSIEELRVALLDSAGATELILASSGSPYILDAELVLARNVTLRAEAPGVVLDAHASVSSPRRVLRVLAGAHVNAYNLSLTGAFTLQDADPGGGAVANEGTLRMFGCDLHDNQAWLGAAVYSSGTLVMHDCNV